MKTVSAAVPLYFDLRRANFYAGRVAAVDTADRVHGSDVSGLTFNPEPRSSAGSAGGDMYIGATIKDVLVLHGVPNLLRVITNAP